MAGSIEEAAAALGADPHQLCKALAVVGQGGRRAAVALVPGGLRLSLRKALSLLPRRLLLPAGRVVPAMRCMPGAPCLLRGTPFSFLGACQLRELRCAAHHHAMPRRACKQPATNCAPPLPSRRWLA